jgi:uncharacterized peroxidase-related enzyme
MVEEDEATEEVAELYDAAKRLWQLPFAPNIIKGMGVSPAALRVYVKTMEAFEHHITLPQTLVAMISFTVAEKSNCTYCAATFELTCRTLGVDEETLKKIAEDLGGVSPERVRTIIEFALKTAKYPQQLEPADYEAVRAQGISNDEIVEIIMVASMAVLNDNLADALKVEVEPQVIDALAQ